MNRQWVFKFKMMFWTIGMMAITGVLAGFAVHWSGGSTTASIGTAVGVFALPLLGLFHAVTIVEEDPVADDILNDDVQ